MTPGWTGNKPYSVTLTLPKGINYGRIPGHEKRE
jgi:hypothetical protein